MPKPALKPTAAPQRLLERRIAVIGTGKIGGILLQGLLKAGLSPERAFPTVRRPERVRSLSTQLAIPVGTDNRAAAAQADVILLCVKPQAVRAVLEEIRPEVTPEKLIVSVAASVPTSPWRPTVPTSPAVAPSSSGSGSRSTVRRGSCACDGHCS